MISPPSFSRQRTGHLRWGLALLIIHVIQKGIGGGSQESFAVVDKDGNLTGILSFDDVREALGQPDLQRMLIARDLANPNVVTLMDTEPLSLVLRKFVDSGRGELPMVDAADENIISTCSTATI